MTTLVTRLYDDPAHADAVVANLKEAGFPNNCMDVIAQASGASAQDRITNAGVPEATAQQYAQHLTSDRALLVVRAPFVPFGAARRAIELADERPAVDAGVANENVNLPDAPKSEYFLSVFGSHRLFLTNRYEVRQGTTPRGFSHAFGIPLLSQKGKRMRPAVIQRGPIFRMKPLSHKRTTSNLLIDRFFATFALPHLWHRKPPRQTRHSRITN
ncbi:hypothetical protein V8J82_01325 [Gymnodinialimonas sp. 2305UL16-5]|uniref:hypothetical protein n=1 Tax=Gymnodinialimonas mytili TaxID=3126503 RepID=UPI0030AF3AC1